MKQTILAVAAFAAVMASSTPASAGIYGDDLTRCLVSSTTDADKAGLAKWIFAAMSADPMVASMSNVTNAQRSALTREFVTIFQRLIFTDCRTQAVAAFKYEGQGVLEPSFSMLGQTAMKQIMRGPAFASTTNQIASDLDKNKWIVLFKGAGIDAGATTSTPPAR